MCGPRRCVKLALPLLFVAAAVVFVRSRRRVEVWHAAVDVDNEGP